MSIHSRVTASIWKHASLSRSFSAQPARGLIECREYTLKPEGVQAYLDICAANSDFRKAHLPFLGMFTPDVGGVMNKIVHFYAWEDLDQRDQVRKTLGATEQWKQFLKDSRPQVMGPQESKIMKEALGVYDVLGMPRTADYCSPPLAGSGKAVYEVREYQLHPGYGSVPKVIDAFKTGLPHKVATDKEGQLVFFGHTDVGMLNNVLEIWRYPSMQASIRAREAARTVQPWKECIGAVTPLVQWFRSSYMVPTPFSSWQ